MKIPYTSVKVGTRFRMDYGDVSELAMSILHEGIIHPPTVDREYNLIAGGRRMKALTMLATGKLDGVKYNKELWQEIPVNILDEEVTPVRLRRLELEENVQRKDFSWIERVLLVDEHHRLSKHEARKSDKDWGIRHTGKLLRMNHATVGFCTRLAALYKKNKNDTIFKCVNMSDAVQMLATHALDKVTKERMDRLAKQKEKEKANPVLKAATPTSEIIRKIKENASSQPMTVKDLESMPDKIAGKVPMGLPIFADKVTYEQVAAFYHIGNCLKLIPEIAKIHKIHHIICDPPYGLDLDNLIGQKKNERVEEEHQVSDNLLLIDKFLSVAWENIEENGFVALWYTPEHYERVKQMASQIGWKVCIWPFVWCKSSGAGNRQAQYNITKATEFCMIMRKSESSILAKKQSRNYLECPSITSSTHPFVKPYPVWQYLIETLTHEGQNVLDPFAGEGSSLSAIFRLNRIPIGIELVEKHAANGISYLHQELNSSVGVGGDPWTT